MKNVFVLESQIYSCLSHPKRLEIVHVLSYGTLTVNELVDMTDLSQVAVSQHLMSLKKMGLVVSEKQGQARLYSLASPQVSHIFEAIRSLLLEKYGVSDIDEINRFPLHVDPVCRMEVTAKGAASSVLHDHKRYYFCGRGCEKKFNDAPGKFIQSSRSEEVYV